MTIFGKQLRDRIKKDEKQVSENARMLGNSVMGKRGGYFDADFESSGELIQIESICRYLGLELPENIRHSDNLDDQIEFFLQPSGATKRRIELTDTWWKNGDGPLLVKKKENGRILALFPNIFRGYHYIDEKTGKKVNVNSKTKDIYEKEAYCFYKPLPATPLSGKDFLKFLFSQLSKSDVIMIVTAVAFITIFGLITPIATKYAFSGLIPSGRSFLLIPLGLLLLTAALGRWLMNVVKASISARINNRIDVVLQNAVYSRVIGLPASFFTDKSAGGLAQMVLALAMVPSILTEIVFGTFLTLIISVIYLVQVAVITPVLAGPAFVIYGVATGIFILTVLQEKRLIESMLKGDEENRGLVFSLLNGIQKIKVSGSETRAYAKWLETYTKKVKPSYAVKFPSTMRVAILTAVHLLGMLWIYAAAFRGGVSIADFTAFSSSFGMAIAGIMALASSGITFSMLDPILNIGKPVLEAVPERGTGKRNINTLSGKIDLDKVVFRYSQDSPVILDKLSLHIKPGEYVAVVGRSGCGKSTLMRLLLGFEEAQQGTVSYDDMDIGSIDVRSLRRNIGTVLQDGKLFTGDIYSNITISAPWMTMDDAWAAAEKAGLADDIRRMPMGMHTLIMEGGGGISGGQKQRLLIARAICPGPNVIMLDEATSALDNITQRIVTDSLNMMKCTRIVIAHRLSTIKECDRIIVLDHGVIAEDGTYDELMKQDGIFAELAKRQLVEEE